MFNSDNSYELFGECQSTNPGVYTNYTMNICHGKYYHRIKYRFATTQELYLEDGNGKKLAETQYIGNGAVFTDMDGKIISRFNLVQQRMFIRTFEVEWSNQRPMILPIPRMADFREMSPLIEGQFNLMLTNRRFAARITNEIDFIQASLVTTFLWNICRNMRFYPRIPQWWPMPKNY
ncbi:MAG: hypothetical protein CMJ19_14675 [Phycisphaeraceae bacterium]|nr:hypothetical protein [Phycisphaeraceae bacterium]